MMIVFDKGQTARQAHVGIPAGLYEEEYGRDGFYGRYTHLYRTAPPVAWSRIEGSLRPRAFDFNRQQSSEEDFVSARRLCLFNADLRLEFAVLRSEMRYYFRNADGDELFFVHEGGGKLETDFGVLTYEVGDYLLIPRGTVYRLLPEQCSRFLIIESRGEFSFPERGLLGQQALYDPAVLRVPELAAMQPPAGVAECEIKVKRGGELSSVFYPHCPLNAVGWRGTLTVWQLNVRDIRPISCDRVHLPPSVHTTFVAPAFIVCSFLPRPLENGDPEALKVPFFHSNIDYDEVLFYHSGDFFSREGIDAGMLTFHPQGIQHGPQPQALARSSQLTHTDEMAVMVDSRQPLAGSNRGRGDRKQKLLA